MLRRHMAPALLAALVGMAGMLAAACAQPAPARATLMVFAAQSLKQPFSKAAPLFEAENPGVSLQFNYAGSGTLAAQLASGAPADVFAAAGSREMDMLDGRGLTEPGTRRNFAGNSLVLVAPLNHPPGLTGFEALAQPQFKRIAAGDPRLAPAGQYAAEVFSYYGISDNIASRLIPCAQVAQVCDYAARGEVDAGLVYMTDFLSRRGDLVLVAQAPSKSHRPVEYPAAVMKGSSRKVEAGKFINFLLTGSGAFVLKECGFTAAEAVK